MQSTSTVIELLTEYYKRDTHFYLFIFISLPRTKGLLICNQKRKGQNVLPRRNTIVTKQ